MTLAKETRRSYFCCSLLLICLFPFLGRMVNCYGGEEKKDSFIILPTQAKLPRIYGIVFNII